MPLSKVKTTLRSKMDLSPQFGEIIKIYSNMIIASRLNASIGDIVSIRSNDNVNDILGIVSVVEKERFSIIPFSHVYGYKVGDRIFINQKGLKIPVGEQLLGRVVDTFGTPIDNMGSIETKDKIPILNNPIKAMNRGLINDVFNVGIKSIDGLLTCGIGQKIGIFAGSGVGKSTLISMIAKGCHADIKVIALIGERGREVKEFIVKNLNNNLTNTIIVVATSDDSPLMRKYGAFSAMSIAEYFKNKGKNVLFIMDSVTRFAMAQREIGLTLGEPPTSKGYPPSVLSLLPQLMERAGKEEGLGSITAFFTILVEGDDLNDPVADQSRSILDGHIILSRELSEFGIYPPINILSSASRVLNDIIDSKHKDNILKFRKMYATLKDNETLIKIGAYQKGSNKEIDTAISKREKLDNFLIQDEKDKFDFDEIKAMLESIFE